MRRIQFAFICGILVLSLMFAPISGDQSDKTSQMTSLDSEVSNSITYDPADVTLDQFDNTSSVDLDIVFLGFNDSIIDTQRIDSNLSDWQAPIERYPSLYSMYYADNPTIENNLLFDMNYTLTFNYRFLSDQDVNEYNSFLQNNGTPSEVPYFDASAGYDSAISIRSEAVESYLVDKYQSAADFTMVVINTFDSDGYMPHYYNNTDADMDYPDFLSRRYSGTTQVAGGSEDSRLLFLDFSAGPNFYQYLQGRDHPTFQSYDLSLDSEIDMLNDQIYQDIQTAVEFKYLASNLYTPIVPKDEVRFEVRLMNFEDLATVNGWESFPTTGYDYFNLIDMEAMVDEFRPMQPLATWNYEILGNYDWTQDSNMVDAVTSAVNTTSKYVSSGPIMNYLDTVWQDLFTPSDENTTVVPMFLWAFPETYGTDFGGVANNVGGTFNYFVSAQSYNYGNGVGYKSSWFNETITDQKPDVTSSSGYLEGYYQGDVFETRIEVDKGDNVTVEILDPVNYNNYIADQPYESVFTITNLDNVTNPVAQFNVSGSEILNIYYWVMHNTGTVNATYDVNVTRYSYLEIGYTRVSVHEGGHAIGVSHPHDGFSWQRLNITDGTIYDDGRYVDWLWDQSYTTMSYAQANPGFSLLDIDSIQRGFIPDYIAEIYHRTTTLIANISDMHQYTPYPLYDLLVEIKTNYDLGIQQFHDLQYYESIENLYGLFDKLDTLEAMLDTTMATLTLEVLGFDEVVSGQTISVSYSSASHEGTHEFNSDDTITISDLIWEDLSLTVTHEGVVVYEFTGYTWDIVSIDVSEFLELDTSDDNSSENSDDSSVTPTTSTDGEGDGSDLDLPVSILSVIGALSLMAILPVLKRRKS